MFQKKNFLFLKLNFFLRFRFDLTKKYFIIKPLNQILDCYKHLIYFIKKNIFLINPYPL